MSKTEETVNKAEIAEFFDVSLTTVDAWIRKGMPYVEMGGNGKAWSFQINDVAAWREKMARSSLQTWRGGHVAPSHRPHDPMVNDLYQERPDLQNGLRFFIESAVASLLEEWANLYAFTTLQFLYERSGDRAEAVAQVQTMTNALFVAAGNWLLDDTYNKSLSPESLDAVWGEVLKMGNITTRPPESRDSLLTSTVHPWWADADTSDVVKAFGALFDEFEKGNEG